MSGRRAASGARKPPARRALRSRSRPARARFRQFKSFMDPGARLSDAASLVVARLISEME
jgi:hypothetical protein